MDKILYHCNPAWSCMNVATSGAQNTEDNWMPFDKKISTIDHKQPGLGRTKPHQEPGGACCFTAGNQLSFHMEMVLLVLWIDFPHLCFLVTSCSSSSVSSLFLYPCHRTVSCSSGNIHPPSSLSQAYCLYIAERKVLGAALLPFSFEGRLWVTFKYDTTAEESLRGSVLKATESHLLWIEEERPEKYLQQVLLSCR